MFCFSRANHASTNLKKFSSSKLDKSKNVQLVTFIVKDYVTGESKWNDL